ncbi:MAG TPA: hypothetical protein ENJ19_03620 [Gammaproteobacteria bacterium]|nr:hypothetical protein [Gammaproteobacteria bacterium]
MATVTIRNLPDDLVERIKLSARSHGCSMEQEVRLLLQARYAERSEIAKRARERWERLPKTSAAEVRRWRETGRR